MLVTLALVAAYILFLGTMPLSVEIFLSRAFDT